MDRPRLPSLCHKRLPYAQSAQRPVQVFQRLAESVHETAQQEYGAFFSSQLGGIVTDAGFMVLHIDDHMVTRGHGVFDTCTLCEGYLYMVDEHITRMRLGCEMVGIPVPWSDAALKRILLDTAAASLKLNGEEAVLACAPFAQH